VHGRQSVQRRSDAAESSPDEQSQNDAYARELLRASIAPINAINPVSPASIHDDDAGAATGGTGATLTVRVIEFVAGAVSTSPAYVAVIVCVPSDSAAVV
jgi:hypothetical protein